MTLLPPPLGANCRQMCICPDELERAKQTKSYIRHSHAANRDAKVKTFEHAKPLTSSFRVGHREAAARHLPEFELLRQTNNQLVRFRER